MWFRTLRAIVILPFAWKNIRRFSIAVVLCAVLIGIATLGPTFFQFWRFTPTNSAEAFTASGTVRSLFLKVDPRLQDPNGDPDNDGLTTYDEIRYQTNPLKADSDQDGKLDGDEIKEGTNPHGVGVLDTDHDGIPNSWESSRGLDPFSSADATLDHDTDSLNAQAEFTYDTNPFDADTDDDGYTDGQEVTNGYNPTGEGLLDTDHDTLPDVWETKYGLSATNPHDALQDADNDDLTAVQEYTYGTDPLLSDTDSDGHNDAHEIDTGYDPTGSGRPRALLTIPKIDVSVPILFTENRSEDHIQDYLQNGIIHYYDTAIPGQAGNSYITGHSSDYFWTPGSYKTIFQDLYQLGNGDTFTITLTYDSGHRITYTYTIYMRDIVAADDPALFQETEGSEITLATCWPLNTNWKRLMTRATLTSVDVEPVL